MRIFNKSKRSFIISREAAISGCRFPTSPAGKDMAYVEPDSEAEVRDSVAEDLLRKYPNEVITIRGSVVKKKIKAKVKSRKK